MDFSNALVSANIPFRKSDDQTLKQFIKRLQSTLLEKKTM
jgi:hypothetical protein